jgi:hypothetical protein
MSKEALHAQSPEVASNLSVGMLDRSTACVRPSCYNGQTKRGDEFTQAQLELAFTPPTPLPRDTAATHLCRHRTLNQNIPAAAALRTASGDFLPIMNADTAAAVGCRNEISLAFHLHNDNLFGTGSSDIPDNYNLPVNLLCMPRASILITIVFKLARDSPRRDRFAASATRER